MAYKQGYNDRMDESLGMRNGKESGMKQSYKARRDESRGMSKSYAKSSNEKYMPKSMGPKVMGHDSSPKDCYVPVGEGFKEVKTFRTGNKGYPSKAFDYKY